MAAVGTSSGGARDMNEAQLGLVLATPTIVAFVVWMYRQGAIPLAGAVVATAMAVVIATVLFLAQ